MKREELQVRRHALLIEPDISRVIIKPFDSVNPRSPTYAPRIKELLKRVLDLTERESTIILNAVFAEFKNRHRDLEGVFQQGYERVKALLPSGRKLSKTQRLLVGSYFACEYSLEAAALFNPSIVPHVDQKGVSHGSLRFIMSLRATGEGHISSIEFRTGIIDKNGKVSLDASGKYVSTPSVNPNPSYTRSEFFAKLQDEVRRSSSVEELKRSLPAQFTRSQLSGRIGQFKKRHGKLSIAQRRFADHLESLLELNYEITFPQRVPLSERAIFPVSSYEVNGIEDARFVRFVDDDGRATYYATYTAYNGKTIMPLLLQTTDFVQLRVNSLSGNAAKNKGMALFPRKIRGRFAMVSRHDAENLYIAYSDNVYQWNDPSPLMQPSFYWEFTQVGNCGSPIETEKGWLLLTHGVGPVRKYCIGAVLLDLDNPAKVIGRLKKPLIAPDDGEREGYVPNVVYTCGAIAHKRRLIVPYAMSDRAVRSASVSIDELIARME
ncbi:MAG TPA: glycoside hydrolase family 130 protein [Bacteroidota bacterium]|nr:glycoside hydrolase family 130 protein [Bacteroidota bacterium]